MTVLAWVAPDTWRACVAAVAERARDDEDVVLVHVSDDELAAAAGGARAGLLGRGADRRVAERWQAVADEDAEALLTEAATALGRPARTERRRGRVEHVLTELSVGADLLVLVRDGERRPGPHSLGRVGRFVVDHALCQVLVVRP